MGSLPSAKDRLSRSQGWGRFDTAASGARRRQRASSSCAYAARSYCEIASILDAGCTGRPVWSVATVRHVDLRAGVDAAFSPTEAPLSSCEISQSSQEINAAELRPVWIDEHTLGIRRLPQQEPRQSRFSARPDHEIGIR